MADGSGVELSAKLQKMTGDVGDAITALHEAVETKNAETTKTVEDWLHKYQDEADKFAKDFAENQKSAKEQQERIEALEVAAATGGGGDVGPNDDYSDEGVRKAARRTDGYKGFIEWARKGDGADIDFKALQNELNVKNTLRTDVDVQGGYLLPSVMDYELRKNITETSPVRSFARNRVMTSKSMSITRRGENMGSNGAPFEGEMEQDDSGISKYVEENVTAFRQSWTVPVTRDLLLSSAFDVENEMMSDVHEHFTLGESRNFILGTGNKGPKGIITDTRCEVIDTAATGVLAFDDFATIAGELKRGYNPWFFMNRRTLAKVWKFKDSDNRPIWEPVPAGGASPATIFTFPYNSDMIHLDDADASNQKPIVFGDLARGYEIYDLAGTEVIRDDYTQKRKALIEYTFYRYLTGQVILPESIKVLKIK